MRNWIEPGAADDLSTRTHKRIGELRARLAEPDTPRDATAIQPAERVALLKSLHDEADRLHQEGGYVGEEAYQSAVAELERQVEQLEIQLGLRPRPKEKPAPVSRKPAAPTVPPRPPREPITWERIWHTLLSERTLRVLLFVGVLLLFASAITLVVYNWERLHPLVAFAMGVGFTSLFYSLGWYVRAKMGLRQSGFALLAIGALLVPVDFYAVYLAGDIFPPEAWGEIWLLASAVCLAAYAATAVLMRIEFFGYLVGVAGRSATLIH